MRQKNVLQKCQSLWKVFSAFHARTESPQRARTMLVLFISVFLDHVRHMTDI